MGEAAIRIDELASDGTPQRLVVGHAAPPRGALWKAAVPRSRALLHDVMML